jgi:phospholipase/carboxylesterase
MSEVKTLGAPLERAKAALILLHGRGAPAESMLQFAETFAPTDVALLAPQAPGSTWWPRSFLAPLPDNEPALTQALSTVAAVLAQLETAGFSPDRCVLLGFSQGGCLALEYTARNAQRYGGVIGLSAGLIGPPGTPRTYGGTLARTPVFLGCSDVDAHIPLARVRESTATLLRLGGDVTERIYPGLGHTTNNDEIDFVAAMLTGLASAV